MERLPETADNKNSQGATMMLERLKELSTKELTSLAAHLRQEIISTVAQNGGHLASNLGVVELTLALHRAFDSPQDKNYLGCGSSDLCP